MAATATLAAALPAAAAPADAGAASGQAQHRAVIPDSKISVQLFNFFYYIGFGQDAAAQGRQAQVLSALSDAGYRNVEPVDYTGFQGLSAQEYRALLDKNHLKASALHTSVSMATTDAEWAQKLETAKTIGAKYIGAGADPRTFTTPEEWVAFAQKIDHFGAMARQQGIQYMVHLHNWEFTSVYGDQNAFQILVDNTSAKNVVFELDLYWATAAGVDPLALVDDYSDRIALLHVKDMAQDGSITTVGEGTIDFGAIFAEAGHGIRYYVVERDPANDPSYDPFGPSLAGLDYLRDVRF
ncbi:sugar phosphate isomerase/epimerase family protein [Demequina soli]|uniref:sugar phosphate isomerase/epimerase family protein n=1 Tax=Demequina soli TaxID=1638987 RepID=UPI00078165C9|nr:sugar phosphate isomerase/epimerase [Demequina soli]